MSDRVLSLYMRPHCLSDLIGQDHLIELLKNQFSSGRIPHFYIIEGPVGVGKTTIARIIALCLQTKEKDFSNTLDWKHLKRYEIIEINAANKNGVDDIRQLSEMVKYKPVPPSLSRVIILDEAHQLTNAAQNALITDTEDTLEHVFYIFCTSTINKIIPALKRRACILSPRLLNAESISILLKKAKEICGSSNLIDELVSKLVESEIASPGLILQAAERFFAGVSVQDSVNFNDIGKIDSLELCRALSTGDWGKCSTILKTVTKNDIFLLKSSCLGYLKSILLKSTGNKAHALAKAMNIIVQSSVDDGVCVPSFLANIFLACEQLSSGSNITITKTTKAKAKSTTTEVKTSEPTKEPVVKKSYVKKTSPEKEQTILVNENKAKK